MTRDKATFVFERKLEDIQHILKRLSIFAEKSFNKDVEYVNWSDVADIARLEMLIGEASDIAFGEGEYADL